MPTRRGKRSTTYPIDPVAFMDALLVRRLNLSEVAIKLGVGVTLPYACVVNESIPFDRLTQIHEKLELTPDEVRAIIRPILIGMGLS